jgi:hypothetical protein
MPFAKASPTITKAGIWVAGIHCIFRESKGVSQLTKPGQIACAPLFLDGPALDGVGKTYGFAR